MSFHASATRRAGSLRALRCALLGLGLTAALSAGARVAVGETLEDASLATLAGGTEPLVAEGKVNVLLFWRPGQEHSLDTLRQMARCGAAFAGKPVRLAGVVSGSLPVEQARAEAAGAAFLATTMVDAGDRLYGELQIRQHPLVVVTDGKGKVALSQPYVRIGYCDVVGAHVRFLLKEIDAAQLDAALHPPRASFPDDDRTAVARRYVKMGRREVEAGRCDRALLSFRKALEIAPQDEEALAGVQACAAQKPRASAE